MDTPYRARPIHLYTICLPILAIGATCIGLGGKYFWFGLIAFLLGIAAGVWIALAGIWQAHSEHMDNLSYHGRSIAQSMQMMDRIRDPNVWDALGYKMPSPEPARIEETIPEAPKEFLSVSFPKPPATPPQMKLLANDTLRGGKMSENRWQGKGKAFPGKSFSTLMLWMEHPDRKYARFINPTYPKLGRVLTRKGVDFFLYYADEEVKRLFETKGREVAMEELASHHPSRIGKG